MVARRSVASGSRTTSPASRFSSPPTTPRGSPAHYTPKHGSWLNMAESELAVLSAQCLNRRIPDRPALEREVTAWLQRRNANHAKADWRFTTADARIKRRACTRHFRRFRPLAYPPSRAPGQAMSAWGQSRRAPIARRKMSTANTPRRLVSSSGVSRATSVPVSTNPLGSSLTKPDNQSLLGTAPKAMTPPEGWGWCYVDEVFFDLSDRATPRNGPIPRCY